MDGRGRTYKHAFGEDKQPAGSRVNLQMAEACLGMNFTGTDKEEF
jgi:hypothetical protein